MPARCTLDHYCNVFSLLHSAYCFAWPAIGPLYDLSELAGCMNPKSVMEVILLPHVAMVVSKQHNYVIETLPLPIKCNGHTINTRLTPSLLDLHHQSTVDLRSYLQIQLNRLRINQQCHKYRRSSLDLRSLQDLACYSGFGAHRSQRSNAALSKTNRGLSSPTARLTQDKHNPLSPVNACVSVRIVRVATGPGAGQDETSFLLRGGHSPNAYLLR